MQMVGAYLNIGQRSYGRDARTRVKAYDICSRDGRATPERVPTTLWDKDTFRRPESRRLILQLLNSCNS